MALIFSFEFVSMNLKWNHLAGLCDFLWQHLAAVATSREKMLIKS